MYNVPEYPLILREQVRRRGFRAFVGPFWDEIESIAFRPNWHADCIADHLQAVHDHEISRLVICMPPRLGKDIASDTPMLTANRGWVLAGEIQIGDQLYGSNGQPTRVLGIWPQGLQPLYRVSFSDGTSLETGKDHLWEVWDHETRLIKTTSDILRSKKELKIPVVASKLRRKIVSIVQTRVAESICYTVDAPDALFCAGRELIVTHNSKYASVLFPAYVWAMRPKEYIFNASYDLGLVLDFARQSNDVIDSELFQRTFPDGARLPQSKFAIQEFSNLQGGKRFSTIIGGRSTGMGAQLQIIDDPAKASAANSEDPKILQNAISNIDGALSTRTHGDPEEFRRVMVMQRLHQKDPAGHAIRDLGWEALILPMEYSRTAMWDCMSTLQFKDPRSEEGELLFPGLWTKKSVERLKIELGAANGGSIKFVSAQLNQDPKVDGGSMVDRDWFGIIDPEKAPWLRDGRKPQLVFSCTDPGAKGTKTSHSRTAMGLYAIYNNRIYMMDRQMGHWRYPEFKDEFRRLHHREPTPQDLKENPKVVKGPWADARKLVVEDKANGTPLLADLGYDPDPKAKFDPQHPFAPLLVAVDPGAEDKISRFRPHTDLIRSGKFCLFRAPWNSSFLDEVCEFPGGNFDDQVDITTMSCQVLVDTTRRGSWAARAANLTL